jgi:hypothetical protein
MKSLEKIIIMLIFLMFIQFVYAQNCNDPDGGLDYSKQSRVTSDYGEYSDECIDSKLLIEAYCTDDNLNLTVYECPYECKDGACVSSVTTTTIPELTTTMTTTTSSVTTSTTVLEECSLDNVTIDTSLCTGMDGTCCQGNTIKATAKISGPCPSEAYLQVDLFGDTGCQIFDNLPIGRDCIGLSDIDGLSFNVDCSGDTCTGSTQLPSGIYVIPVPICVGVTVNPVDAGLYKDGFPCEGDNPVSYYNAWTNLVYGSITFGTDSQCSATITTTSTISTVSTTITQTTTSSSVSTTTTTLSNTPSIDILQTDEKCDSCSDGCAIECNHIKRRNFIPYDDKDFFKFTLDRRMRVRIRLNSTNDVNKKLFGDYDLYVKWDGSCPDINPYYCLDGCPECSKANCCDSRTGNYDCGPCSESIDELNNMNEFCPEEGERILEPGTYYFMVYNFVGNVPYDVNLICSNIIETTTTILENTGPGGGRTFTSTSSYTTTTFPRETVTTYQEYTTTTEEYTTTTEADKSEGKTPMTNVITKNYILIIATILSLILLVLGIYKIIGKRTEPKPDYTEPEYTEENVEQPLY